MILRSCTHAHFVTYESIPVIAPSLTSLFVQIRTVRGYGGGNETFRIIQDDLLHPILGGNKLRKLDALMPAFSAEGITDLVKTYIYY